MKETTHEYLFRSQSILTDHEQNENENLFIVLNAMDIRHQNEMLVKSK